jgi:hypothetical protein
LHTPKGEEENDHADVVRAPGDTRPIGLTSCDKLFCAVWQAERHHDALGELYPERSRRRKEARSESD